METTVPQLHPAIQRYLTVLSASLQETPGVAPDEGLADAQEYLLSEWESIARRQPSCSADALYRHFVGKFGSPAEVAAGYAGTADPATLSGAVNQTGTLVAAVKPRRLLVAAVIMQAAALAGGLACVLVWRAAAASAASGAIQAGPSAAIHFNRETMACAGSVVSSRRGPPQQSQSTDPRAALGLPDCLNSERQRETSFSLGRGGELVVEFTDRRLCDGQGADLAIFEVGYEESVKIAVSDDARTWIDLGRIAGGVTTLDLATYGLEGRQFRFVRVTDAQYKLTSREEYWGADIDAVVALHATSAR